MNAIGPALHTARRTTRRDPARRTSAHRQDACPPTARCRSSASCWRSACPRSRSARWRDPTSSRHWPTRSTSSPRSTPEELARVLDLGGDAAARREGRGRRCAQLPVLLLGVGFPQQGQHRAQPPRTAWRRCPTPSGSRHEVGGAIQLCIATAFTCPFEGLTDPERVIGIAADPRPRAPTDIVVCDTIGQAIPTQVTDLIHGVRERTPQRRIVFHGHDTWGLGVANTLAAIDAGATHGRRLTRRPRRLPVRPRRQRQHLHRGPVVRDATGLASRPSTLASMVEITDKLLAELGEPNRSRSAQGARSKSTAFDWVIGSSGDRTCRDVIPPSWSPTPSPSRGWARCALRAVCMCPTNTDARGTPRCLRSGDFDVVVAQLSDRFDADLLATAKLAGISNYAVGYDNIDIPAATANGIPVGNTPGVLTDATADLAMLLILATARRAVEADQFTRSGQFTGWKPELLLGQDVSGATLGLAGFGRIARATAQRAAAFGMDDHVLLAPTRWADRRRRGTRPSALSGASSRLARTRRSAATSFPCMCRWPRPPGI